jgi:nucleoside-diphosphate-sugar epimerase
MVFGYGYGNFGDHLITEDDEYGPRGADAELERHLAGMRTKEQLTFGTPGLEGIALRFGAFYGAGGTETIVELLRKRQLPVPADRDRVLPWVELSDAGRAVAAAVEHGRPGQAYNVVDRTPMGFRGHLLCVAEEFALPKPMTVPLWATRPLSYAHTMFRATMRVSAAKAERELGWTPAYPSSRDGLAALRAATR